ncbi:MAG: hypothetical protein HFH68_10105 [Lachnospiraceae bacterium]|nr:hypothetical protein [Lachnospiraceae bacterium]
MDTNMPLPGSFYRYPDGSTLQIICIANNCIDKEKNIVYQKMFPPFDIWTEPLSTFIKETGNNGVQIYKSWETGNMPPGINIPANNMDIPASTIPESDVITDSMFREALLNGAIDRKIAGKIPDREIAEKGFMELLDARTYHEKYIIFTSLRKYLDKRLLNNIAVALDIVLEDGDEEEQYDSVLHCLQTFEHYETQRLR